MPFSCLKALVVVIAFSTHLRALLSVCPPALPCISINLAVPALWALAVPLGEAFPVLHGASSVSTAKSDFNYDKVLGSPSLTLLGSLCRGPNPALSGIRWQQVTEVTQVTMVRQVIEVS